MTGESAPLAGSLLVVCQANLVRSPLAACLLRGHLERHDLAGRTVVSAGLEPAPGAVVSAEAVSAARDLGVDLGGHRPRAVSARLLLEAGLVMTMTEAQRATVERLAPQVVTRTFTARELVRLLAGVDPGATTWSELAAYAHRRRPRVPPASTTEDVPDPVGRDLSFHREVAGQLDALCDRVAAALAPGEAG